MCNETRAMADNERPGQGHLQPDKHRYHLKGDAEYTPEGWGGAHMGIPERIDAILNWTELNWNAGYQSHPAA